MTGIAVPPVNRVEWKGAVRIIRSIYPPIDGTVRISVCGRAVDHQAAMALMKRSPKITANCA
ncbi:hypothetical protein RZ533_25880, partial [Sphingobium yanoikuyae]|nr:hypothetical protein [Sphingobium yanoikuyae]